MFANTCHEYDCFWQERSATGLVWGVRVQGLVGEGRLEVAVLAESYTDLAGNLGKAALLTVTRDTTGPSVDMRHLLLHNVTNKASWEVRHLSLSLVLLRILTCDN